MVSKKKRSKLKKVTRALTKLQRVRPSLRQKKLQTKLQLKLKRLLRRRLKLK